MAKHVSNFLQTNEQIILDLINEQNSATITTPFVPGDIVLGVPAKEGADPLKVSLKVTGDGGKGFKGEATVKYNRVDLAFMNPTAGDELYVEVTTQTKHSQLLTQLNDRFGLLLTAADIVEGDIPAAGGEGVVVGFDLVATADNLVWANKVRVVRVGELTDISTLVLVTDLDGLHAPEVQARDGE